MSARLIATLLATTLMMGACSGGGSGSESADPTEPASADTDVTGDPDTAALVAAITTLQAARADAAVAFEDGLAVGRPLAPLAIDLFDADRRSASEAVTAMKSASPARTVDEVARLLDATRELAMDAAEIHAALVDLDARVVAATPEDIAMVVGDHVDVFDAWRDACFSMSQALDVDESVDCIGLIPPPDGDRPDGVEVSIECTFGSGAGALPFDTSPYDWLQAPALGERSWLFSQVRIDNGNDSAVQLWTGQRVRYLDADGEVVAELPWTEVVDVALRARPGQTVIRTGLQFADFTFPVQVRASEFTDTDVAEVYARAESCELAEPVHVIALDPAGDDDLIVASEPTCRRDEVAGLMTFEIEVTNATADDHVVDVTVEFVDDEGTRLGMTGAAVAVAAGATASTGGQSVLYTVARPDDWAACRVIAAQITPWD